MSSKPFAYNPSNSVISGVTNVGNISIGTSGQDYSANPGGLTWWMGPNESTGYVIGLQVAGENQPTPVGGVGNVQFWQTPDFSDLSFLSLVNYIKRDFGGVADLATAADAADWLSSNGYYTTWTPPTTTTTTAAPTTTTTTAAPTTTTTTAAPSGLVTSGLIFNLQTAPSSGTTWTDASGNGYNANLAGTPTYVSNNGGGIRLNNSGPNGFGNDYISVPYNISSNTVTVEVVASFNPNGFWATIWGNESWSAGRGYLAYVAPATSINFGRPGLQTSETITASNAIRHWIFVINGTQASLFLNGSQVGTADDIGNQTLFATSEFYFGARHVNNGIGPADRLNNTNSALYPVFYQMRVYNRALSGLEVSTNFNAIKSTYGL